MTPSSQNLRYFIDLENLSWANPDICAQPFNHVILFIGPKQAKLNVEWIQLSIDHPGQIELIRLTESAPNALDFILACHIGRATIQHPNATYHIISNDKGFDPLVRHLRSIGVTISRLTVDAPSRASNTSHPVALTLLPQPFDLSEKARQYLSRLGISRPKRRATLASSLRSQFRQQSLSDHAVDTLILRLIQSRYLMIDPKNVITYAA